MAIGGGRPLPSLHDQGQRGKASNDGYARYRIEAQGAVPAIACVAPRRKQQRERLRRTVPGHLVGSARGPGRVDLREEADLAGDREEVVRGVERVFGGVELVEHGADQGRLANVLRDADPLRVGGAGDRGVCPVGEPDRGGVEGHRRNLSPRRGIYTRLPFCGSFPAIAVVETSSSAQRAAGGSVPKGGGFYVGCVRPFGSESYAARRRLGAVDAGCRRRRDKASVPATVRTATVRRSRRMRRFFATVTIALALSATATATA